MKRYSVCAALSSHTNQLARVTCFDFGSDFHRCLLLTVLFRLSDVSSFQVCLRFHCAVRDLDCRVSIPHDGRIAAPSLHIGLGPHGLAPLQWISLFEEFTGIIDCQNCPLCHRPGGQFKIWQSQMSPLVVAARRQRLRIDSSFHIRLGFHYRAPFVVGRSTAYANRYRSAQHCPQIVRNQLRRVEIRDLELADGIVPTSSASRQRLSERIV